jgi:pectate lyase
VLFVENTEAAGPGSFRAAVEAVRDDRYTFIVFRTGGRIRMTGDELYLTGGCVYIAGQTAPGDGIAIDARRGVGLWIRGSGENIGDVAIRHLRIRGGSTNINISAGQRIILDHLSLSWASNYILAIQRYPWSWSYPISNVSVQNSIVSEVLGVHPTAFVLGSGSDLKEAGNLGMENISIHRNLMASNSHRNPMTAADNTVIANNVIYNWRNAAGIMNRRGSADWTNNLGKAGPMTRPEASFLVNAYCDELGGDFSIYASGNVGPATSEIHADNWVDPNRQVACMRNTGEYSGQEVPEEWRRDIPQVVATDTFPFPLHDAEAAYDLVLNDVGANARVTCSGMWEVAVDAIDARVIRETRRGSGPSLPPESAGPWTGYDVGEPCVDSDGDGLPDAWEEQFFGCPTCASPAEQAPDGYLLIEHYVNGTNPHIH